MQTSILFRLSTNKRKEKFTDFYQHHGAGMSFSTSSGMLANKKFPCKLRL